MKILTFDRQVSFQELVKEFRKRAGESFKKEVCHFSDISCLCLSKEWYENNIDLLKKYQPMIEDNVRVKVHGEEVKDQFPWGVDYVGGQRLWKKSMGEGVKVGIIDTGISRKHPDLKGQVAGGVDFVKGKIGGHGTHVAGTIAALLNNKGIVGIAPKVKLYDIRAFAQDGTASMSDIIKGIDWCIRNGMHVINMSFGSDQSSEALYRMIQKGTKAGIIMVASAGNSGGAIEYPGAYKGVISVGALTKEGKLADFSSRGKLGAKAPGVEIYSTWLEGKYKTLDGTSMAAAHVSGLAALRVGERLIRSNKAGRN